MNGIVAEVRRWQLWFPILLVLIGAVSVYDTWLIIRFSDWITDMEVNPVGRWLLGLGDGGVEIFVRAKVAGTLIVLSALTGLWLYRSRLTFLVTTSVASCQLLLFVYLTAI
jgi:hypothetical protein